LGYSIVKLLQSFHLQDSTGLTYLAVDAKITDITTLLASVRRVRGTPYISLTIDEFLDLCDRNVIKGTNNLLRYPLA
jgi:hypothetical protein